MIAAREAMILVRRLRLRLAPDRRDFAFARPLLRRFAEPPRLVPLRFALAFRLGLAAGRRAGRRGADPGPSLPIGSLPMGGIPGFMPSIGRSIASSGALG